MAKWPKRTRLLKLMSELQWAGITGWELKPETLTNVQVPKFLQWFNDSLEYIPSGDIRESLVKYYQEGTSVEAATGFYTLVTAGRLALQALYNYQKVEHGQR